MVVSIVIVVIAEKTDQIKTGPSFILYKAHIRHVEWFYRVIAGVTHIVDSNENGEMLPVMAEIHAFSP